MGKINFEEYRQPWETGAHWELKREFMEKYQNDFPEDRLLCLAQAYSNIELLNCSYPDPVMLQIHELSKPLIGCKHFDGLKKNLSKDGPELQARAGKRIAQDDFKKPFKFIKFHSVGVQNNPASDLVDDHAVVDTKTPQEDESDTIIIQKPISEVSPETNSVPDLGMSESTNNCKDPIMLLSQSEDLKLFENFETIRKKLQGTTKSNNPVQVLDNVVQKLNLQGIISYKFEKVKVGANTAYLCKLYVKDTLVCTGRCTSEKSSLLIAAHYGIEVFTNISNLPTLELEDLKNPIHENKKQFVNKVFKEFSIKSKLTSVDKVVRAIATLKCPSEVTFFLTEDLDSPLNTRLYECHIVIANVRVSVGKSTGKKKAKSDAADQLTILLGSFFGELSNDDNCITANTTDGEACKSKKAKAVIKKNQKKEKLEQQVMDSQSTSFFVNPDCFEINHRLLNNSLEQDFVVIDATALTASRQIRSVIGIVHQSAQYCKKNVQVLYSEGRMEKQKGLIFRCDILIENECLGSGTSPSKVEAKEMASHMALKNLEEQFYTIVATSELEGAFTVDRNQLMNSKAASDAVSESNVGCKMLKMMGWTGGGIGKTGGITEPIMPGEHRFHQGLGFADNNKSTKKFQSNVESLLREFSQTDTTTELCFSKDFTKEERQTIHKVATKFGLIGTSRGKSAGRQLYVKHKFSAMDLLKFLVKAGGSTCNYQLVDKSSQ